MIMIDIAHVVLMTHNSSKSGSTLDQHCTLKDEQRHANYLENEVLLNYPKIDAAHRHFPLCLIHYTQNWGNKSQEDIQY